MAQNAMFSGQAAYAQQLAYPMMAATNPGMPPPPPPVPPISPFTMSSYQTGQFGQQMAGQMGQMGMGAITGMNTAMGSAFNVAGSLGGIGLGMVGGIPGAVAGMGLGMAAMLPGYIGARAIDLYGGSAMRGMQEQQAINQTLRQNFNFVGGQGPMNRGFNSGQMGQIGQMLNTVARRDVFTSVGELQGLVQQGAQMGEFAGVRDVQQFTQRFRRMLDTLRQVQDELGGTLTDAINFARQSQQVGIFQAGDRVNFARQMRGAEAASGLSQPELMGLASRGAQISRAYGGLGRQGAVGALRGVSTLGAAVTSGAIDQEMVSEATGGLTGNAALSQAVSNILQQAGQFSRRATGRYATFGLSNEDGTGVDEAMMQRFLAGDITTGQVGRAARRNVNRMGRARALNQEGQLRGAIMEQGGLAGQIGLMRLRLGDRVLDQGDDVASYVMQRRFGINRPQAELMMSLIRNQGSIAEQESFDRRSAQREQAFNTDMTENRSFDAFFRTLQRGVEEGTGAMEARRMGQRLQSRLAQVIERAMNDMLGVTQNQLTQQDNQTLNRLALGRASSADLRRLGVSGGFGGMTGGISGRDLRGYTTLTDRMRGGSSPAEMLEARGYDVDGMSAADVDSAVRHISRVRSGALYGAQGQSLDALLGDADGRAGMSLAISRARLLSGGDSREFYRQTRKLGGADMVDAFAVRAGFGGSLPQTITAGSLMNRGGGELISNIGADMRARMGYGSQEEALAALTGGLASSTDYLGRSASGTASFLGDLGRAAFRTARGDSLGRIGRELGLSSLSGLAGDSDEFAEFIGGGGTLGRRLRQRGAAGTGLGRILGGRIFSTRDDRMLQSVTSGTDEALAAFENTTVQDDVQALLQARDSREFQQRLGVLAETGAGLEGGQRTAVDSLIEEIRSGSKNGVLSGGMRRRLQGIGMSTDRRRQQQQEIMRISGDYREIGRGFSAAGLRGLGDLSQNIAQGLGGEGPLQGPDAVQGGMANMISQLAALDPESEQYRTAMGALGESDFGRTMMQVSAQRRQRNRDMSGRGRRGRRGAADSVLGALTGNTLSQMEFEVGGRTISGGRRDASSMIMGMLERGGEDGQSIQEQLTRQLQEQGSRNAPEIMSRLQEMLSTGERGRGTGLSTKEADELNQMIEQDTGIRERTRERTAARQRQDDPLGDERNTTLRSMLAELQSANQERRKENQRLVRALETEGVSPSETSAPGG
jgi:hypothetical protein